MPNSNRGFSLNWRGKYTDKFIKYNFQSIYQLVFYSHLFVRQIEIIVAEIKFYVHKYKTILIKLFTVLLRVLQIYFTDFK